MLKRQSLFNRWSLRLEDRRLAIAALVVILVFSGARIWRLGSPAETVFDEVYFPKMASQYVSGESFFDIHPPLGKLLIALGELVAGNTPVGWRLMSLVTGLAMFPIAYWTAKTIFNDRRAGWLAAILIGIDGLFIVYSRTGLMDGFMLLAGLASLGFCWQFRRRRLAGEQAWSSLILTGVTAGLAVAVKWIGAGFLPIVALTILLTLTGRREPWRLGPDLAVWGLAFIVLPFLIYTLPFLANWQTNFWAEFTTWHQQSWGYNINLDAKHPYSSEWWSWPFLIRPIWFYYKNEAGNVIGVDGIGNPIVWWGSTLAVVYTLLVLLYVSWLRYKKQPRLEQALLPTSAYPPLLFVIAGWALFYLPWTAVGRVLFLYHYFGSYLFALLITAWWLSQTLAQRHGRAVTLAVLALAVATAVVFLPIWTAYPIPQAQFDRLMWFRSWI